MEQIDINKGLYDAEIEMSERLNSKINNSLTLLTIIGTGIAIISNEIFPLICEWYSIIFYTSCLISIISFLYCIKCFKTAYTDHAYSYVNLSQINITCSKYINSMKLAGYAEETINCNYNTVYLKMLTEMYLNCALQNRQTNIQKNEHQRILTYFIIVSFICVMINFIIYLIYINTTGGTLYD